MWDVDSYCHLTRSLAFGTLRMVYKEQRVPACPSVSQYDTAPSPRAPVAGRVRLQSGVCRSHTPGTVGDICCAQCHTPTPLFLAEDQGTLTTAAHPSKPPLP